VKIPKSWIEKWITYKWITYKGRRVPILKKEALATCVKFRNSPLELVSSSNFAKRFEQRGFLYKSFRYEKFPPSEVATMISRSSRKLDNLLKDSPFYRDYEQQLLGFFDERREGIMGSFVNYHVLVRSGKEEKLNVAQYLAALSEGEQVLARRYFSHSLKMVEITEPYAELIKDARVIFPNDNMGFIGIGTSFRIPNRAYDRVLNHEVGHMISSRLERESITKYYVFGPDVYAPYIKRVLPQVPPFVSTQGITRRERNRLFYKLELLSRSPSSEILSSMSLRSPEEGFSEAFSFYSSSNPEKVKLLKKRWPEAYDYFKKLMKGD